LAEVFVYFAPKLSINPLITLYYGNKNIKQRIHAEDYD